MSSQLGVRVGCLGVSVTGGGEDSADLDAGLEALLAEREAAELGKVVADSCTATTEVSKIVELFEGLIDAAEVLKVK